MRRIAFGIWDPQALTWDVFGPAATGGPAGSPGPDGVPGTEDDTYALEPWPYVIFHPATSTGASAVAGDYEETSSPESISPIGSGSTGKSEPPLHANPARYSRITQESRLETPLNKAAA